MSRRHAKKRSADERLVRNRTVFALAMAGGALLYAAFPPIGFFWLAWLAPVPWIILIERAEPWRFGGWVAIWLGSAVYWLLMLQGIRLAHWANNFGWLALSAYLGLYLPAFVALTRVAVHRLHIRGGLAAPVVWTGLELARGHVITGFSVALLGHTQARWPILIQTADLFGAYAASFHVMFVSVCAARMLQPVPFRSRLRTLAAAAIAFAFVLGYGALRLNSTSAVPSPARDGLRVAIVQASFDKVFEFNPERSLEAFLRYRDLSLEARRRDPELDAIIWPESVFTANAPELILDGEERPPSEHGLSESEYRERLQASIAAFQRKARLTADYINRSPQDGGRGFSDICLIVGTESVHLGKEGIRDYNSVLLVRPSGEIAGRYYKMHPVMFGEYIPFGDVLPWLYRLTPMQQGLTPGKTPSAMKVGDLWLCPSICFESTVPHLIRRHVVELTRSGTPPDVLINVTDDGWFWGSSILDLQFTCAVFRAVELRRPFLVAANTGISAWIDSSGRVLESGPRRQERIILAKVARDGRISLYQRWGDWPVAFCLVSCLLLAVVLMFRGGRKPGATTDKAASTGTPTSSRAS